MINAVLWHLRYKLSLREVAEMRLTRGFAVTNETMRQWEARFAPPLADRLRAKRRGRRSESPATEGRAKARSLGFLVRADSNCERKWQSRWFE